MSFLNKVVEKESYVPEMIKQIKSSNLPLFFYGAAEHAKLLYRNLIKLNDIKIDEYVITITSEDNNIFFYGNKVNSLDSVEINYDKFNVILALQKDADIVIKKINSSLKVNKIFRFDFMLGYDIRYGTFSYSFFTDNEAELNQTYNMLDDHKSKEVMIAYINQKISGKITFLNNLYENDQYFNDFTNLHDNEVFVDCGAYNGDTIKRFLTFSKGVKVDKIIAFEPDKKNFSELILLKSSIPQLICINKGTWHEKTELYFTDTGGQTGAISSLGELSISVDTIDNILNGEKATFIKLDVEGSELQSLKGASETIKKYKPKLAVCMYHKQEDLLFIPKYLKSLVPEYKFYLRHYSKYCSAELVLYAII